MVRDEIFLEGLYNYPVKIERYLKHIREEKDPIQVDRWFQGLKGCLNFFRDDIDQWYQDIKSSVKE